MDRLRVLLEVREAGSIAKAAGEDPVRQSQYSRQLKELDEYFGSELTERKGRSISLTPAGIELANLIKEHFVALGNFSRRVSGESVPVFIGAGESLIHWLLLPLVEPLQHAVPGITLRLLNLTSGDISRRLSDRDMDFGILKVDAMSPNLTCHKLGRIGYSLFVSRKMLHELKGKRDQSLLSKLPIAAMPGDATFGRLLHQLAEKATLQLNVQLECDTFTGLARAVESGSFAAVLPDLADKYLAGNIDKVSLPILNPLARELCLAWQKRKVDLRPELEKVRGWLVKNAKV